MTTDVDGPEPNEDALIDNIIRVMQYQLARDYAPEATRRDAHPKHTGLLEATFSVLGDLPPHLRVGLFAQPRSYRAWVRTSNASTKVKSDAEKDVRGFAIKVRGVDGAKLPDSDEPESQDFVLLSTPHMPLGTVKLFHDAIYYSTKSSILLFAAKMVLTGRPGAAEAAERPEDHPTLPAGDPLLEHHALPAGPRPGGEIFGAAHVRHAHEAARPPR